MTQNGDTVDTMPDDDHETMTYARVEVEGRSILIPHHGEDIEAAARAAARQLARAERALDDEALEGAADEETLRSGIATVAASTIATHLLAVYQHRAEEPLTSEAEDEHLETLLGTYTKALTATLEQGEDRLVRNMHRHIIAWTFDLFDEKHTDAKQEAMTPEEHDQAFRETYEASLRDNIRDFINTYAGNIAGMTLEDIDPEHVSLAELREYLRLDEPTPLPTISAPSAMRLSTDRAAREFAMWLAGERDPGKPDADGFYRLDVPNSRGHAATVYVRSGVSEIVDPDSVEDMLERIQGERNEAKAKAFVGTFAFACQKGVDPTSFRMSAEDLMLMTHGYERSGPNKTNATYYWKGMAESVTHLFRDLPYTEIGMIVQLPDKETPSYTPRPLMHRPTAIFPLENRHMFKGHLLQRIYDLSLPSRDPDPETAAEETAQRRDELAKLLRSLEIESFQFGYPIEIMEAFGSNTGTGERNALVEAPRELLKLKGPAFWLAWDVLFLTRWAKGAQVSIEKGSADLLEALEKLGYLGKSRDRTGKRVSYTVALRKWLADLNTLMDIGVLDDPGAEVYQYRSGRWFNRTKDLRKWVESRGTRITEQKLQGLRVVYTVAKHRAAALEPSKKKAEGHSTRKRANANRKKNAG